MLEWCCWKGFFAQNNFILRTQQKLAERKSNTKLTASKMKHNEKGSNKLPLLQLSKCHLNQFKLEHQKQFTAIIRSMRKTAYAFRCTVPFCEIFTLTNCDSYGALSPLFASFFSRYWYFIQFRIDINKTLSRSFIRPEFQWKQKTPKHIMKWYHTNRPLDFECLCHSFIHSTYIHTFFRRCVIMCTLCLRC